MRAMGQLAPSEARRFKISPSPPIKKTPLVGVFFIGCDGEPHEISASCKRRRKGMRAMGQLAPSEARRFKTSPSPPIINDTICILGKP